MIRVLPPTLPSNEVASIYTTGKIDPTCWFITEMDSLRALYEAATERKPMGWIMGIDEYQSLKKEIAKHMSEDQKRKFGELEHFQGVPIVLKSSRGIELALDVHTAVHFKNVKSIMITRSETMT